MKISFFSNVRHCRSSPKQRSFPYQYFIFNIFGTYYKHFAPRWYYCHSVSLHWKQYWSV